MPPTCADETVFKDVNKDKCALFVPIGAIEDYKYTYVWWDFNNIVEKDMSGVEEMFVDDVALIEYYDLNGVKVSNPQNGVYIKKQGSKTTKVVL